jgi:hypothetical protein
VGQFRVHEKDGFVGKFVLLLFFVELKGSEQIIEDSAVDMVKFHADVLKLEEKPKNLHGPCLDTVIVDELQKVVQKHESRFLYFWSYCL